MSKVTMPEPVACLWIRDGSVVNAFAHTPNLKEGDQLSEYFAEKGFAEEPLITTTQAEAYADARVRGAHHWQPIETAPKDCPILAYCDHEADPYHTNDPGGRLTLYAAHYEGLSHCGTGIHIVEWGGAWDDRTYEDSSGGFMPDWWFVAGSEFEVAANPTHWMPLPAPPTE